MLSTIRQTMDLIGRDQRGRWILLVVLALAVSGVELLGAVLIYTLIGLVADPEGEIELPFVGDVRSLAGDVDERTLLLGLVIGMAVFFVLRGVFRIASVYVQARVAHNAGARLSIRLVEGYLSWPYPVHLRRNSAELIRNAGSAVQQLVVSVFLPVIRVSAESLFVVGMIVLLVALAPVATAIAIVVVGGAALVVLLLVQPRLKRLGRISHRMQGQALQSVQQPLQGIRDIKILGRERYFVRRYARSRRQLARVSYLRPTVNEIPHTVIEIALIGFILLFFGVTIVAGDDAAAVLPVLGLFAYAGLRLRPSLQKIIRGLNDIRFAAAPLDDLYGDVAAMEALREKSGAGEPLAFDDAIVLDGVDFRYEGSDVDALSGINLTVRPGDQIGVCGPTGGGKTTLVDIITGLLEPTVGCVTVDGKDLRRHAREWHRNLGVVPQMVFLTDDTLRRNVALGVPDAAIDDSALAEAIELSQLTEFVESLPDGLETTVGERGVRISGGQRQRIAIARALYRRPAVLIFDEGTSALDNATEALLMASIERLRGEHTIILIAHRLSTVQNSDRVIFVEQGRVTGEGTFAELTRSNERFRALAGAG